MDEKSRTGGFDQRFLRGFPRRRFAPPRPRQRSRSVHRNGDVLQRGFGTIGVSATTAL